MIYAISSSQLLPLTRKTVPSLAGLVLLLAFFLQYFLGWKWQQLEEWQQLELYKRWSGLALALLFGFQWMLTASRVLPGFRKYALQLATLHKWAGAISPLLFYIHSSGIGYGYLGLLTYVFVANTLIGLVNLELVRKNSLWLFNGWMITHVALSMVLTLLMGFHIGIVFYYK